MARKAAGRKNEEVARIVAAVRGALSFEQAANHIDWAITDESIRRLENGRVGREDTVRAFAEGFCVRFRELFEDEIAADFGDCTTEHVSDWFAEKAGFMVRPRVRLVPSDAPSIPEDLVFEDVDVRSFRGAANIPENDARIINEVVRRMIRDARRNAGQED